MRTGERVPRDYEIASACDASIGIPSRSCDKLIEDQRLERGPRSGKRSRRFGRMIRSEELVRSDIENQDSCGRCHASGVPDRQLPIRTLLWLAVGIRRDNRRKQKPSTQSG